MSTTTATLPTITMAQVEEATAILRQHEAEKAAERKRKHEAEVAAKVEAKARQRAAAARYPAEMTSAVKGWVQGIDSATTRMVEILDAARTERDEINAVAPGLASVTAGKYSATHPRTQILAVKEAVLAGLGIENEFEFETAEHYAKGRNLSRPVTRQNPASKLLVDALEANTPEAWQTALELTHEMLQTLYVIHGGIARGRKTLPDCNVTPLVDKRAFMNELCNRVYGETV